MSAGGVLEECVRIVGSGMIGSVVGALGRVAVTVVMVDTAYMRVQLEAFELSS